MISTKDYYPFGTVRVNSGSASPARGYIGEFSDVSNLSYLNARYMEPSRGQFLSQDPTFLALGNPDKLQQLTKLDQQQFLTDPQQLNSYSYAKNNPIIQKDPTGNFAPIVWFAGAMVIRLGSYALTTYRIKSFCIAKPMQKLRWIERRPRRERLWNFQART